MDYDMDSSGDILEGIWHSNPRNIDLSTLTPKDATFETFKFTLDTDKRTFEGRMYYPVAE